MSALLDCGAWGDCRQSRSLLELCIPGFQHKNLALLAALVVVLFFLCISLAFLLLFSLSDLMCVRYWSFSWDLGGLSPPPQKEKKAPKPKAVALQTKGNICFQLDVF